MELGFIESLRRRWEVLGITAFPAQEAPSASEVGNNSIREEDPSSFLGLEEDQDIVMGLSPQNVDKPTDVDTDGVDGAQGRRQILEGAIVKSVIDSAAQGKVRSTAFKNTMLIFAFFPKRYRKWTYS